MAVAIQSLARGLGILRLVAASPQGLQLRDVADLTGLNRPAAHKLLNTLVMEGFVEKTRAPVLYRIGAAVFEMSRLSRESDLDRRALEILGDMSGRLPKMTLTMARYLGGEVVTVLRISPERKGFVERPLDAHMSPYGSASSLLFQAFWTVEERSAYRRRHVLSESGGHAWRDLEEVDRFLGRVRGEGCCEPPVATGIFRVAAPVLDSGGRIVGCLGASKAAALADEPSEMRSAVVEAARALGADIDWVGQSSGIEAHTGCEPFVKGSERTGRDSPPC